MYTDGDVVYFIFSWYSLFIIIKRDAECSIIKSKRGQNIILYFYLKEGTLKIRYIEIIKTIILIHHFVINIIE